MPNQKISQLPAATDITGSETIPIVQGGVTKQIAAAEVGKSGAEYTIVVIPDTQYLSQDWPTHFDSLANFISTNKDAMNIQLVMHVGDVVQIGNDAQYLTASGPMNTLYGLGVPFLAAIGNHDYDNTTADGAVTDSRPATRWNANFGQDRYTTKDWFDGEFFEVGKSENFYARMNLGGRETIVLVLECFPRKAVMTWADTVVKDNASADVILLTHSYIDATGAYVNASSTNDPSEYAVTDYVNGQEMWMNHFANSPNLVASFNGHHLGGNLALKTDYNKTGGLVHQQFNNWQNSTEGGQGRIVLFTVNAETGRARRRVYNPATALYESAQGYERTFNWFLSDPTVYTDKLASATDLLYHLDATEMIGGGWANGAAIGTIPDFSGNEYNAAALETMYATFQEGVLNGNPVIRFNGNARYRYSADNPVFFNQPRHVFVVVKRNAAGTGREYVFDGLNLTGNPRNLFALNGTGGLNAMWANVWLYGSAVDTVWHKFELIFDGAASLMLRDDVQVASGDAGVNSLTPITIGGTSLSAAGDLLNGDIAEIKIYNKILSTAEKDVVQSELLTKWGL